MLRQVLIRTATAIPLLLLVSAAAFFLGTLSRSSPGAIIVGQGATPEQIQEVEQGLGLDRPAWTRFVEWLGMAVRGDLGSSFYSSAPVADSIMQALPVTLSLTVGGLFVAMALGVPAGIFSALRAGKPTDRTVGVLTSFGQAVPSFWLGMILIIVFSLQFPLLPAIGYVPLTESVSEWAMSLLMPSVALGLAAAASIARQTRSSLIGVLQQEYIRTALSKGLSKRRIILKHALKNAASPVVTVIAFQVVHLLSGSVVIERVFNMRGLGTLAIDSAVHYDPYVIQAVVVVSVVMVLVVYLLLDIGYAWLNPKVRAL